MRINKFLALAGIASRRKVESLITAGQIKVNKKVMTELAYDVKESDVVEYNGEVVTLANEYVYYMLNKPKGYVTTVSDELNRKTVMDLLHNIKERVFPIGRLDYNTEGLLLFTNDGELANRIMKPNFEIEKTYVCEIEGEIKESELAVLRAGVVIDGKRLNKCKAKLKEFKNNKSKIEITINQGLNRQVRKMMEFIGKTVVNLKRTKIGELKVGGLSRGEVRKLKDNEIQYLYALCDLSGVEH